MADDVEFGTDDVFAEIESDPLAEEELPPGVQEAELPGDDGDPLAEPAPGEFLEEPEEPELPGEEEALAAAAAAEPDPKAPPAPPPAPPEPEPEPPAEPPAPPPEPEPAPENPPAAAEPEPEPDPKPKAAPKKRGKAKAKAKKGEKKPRATTREYVVLYEIEGGFAIGATVIARSPTVALEEAFPELVKLTGQDVFSKVVAVPSTNWKPVGPMSGKQEVRSRISIG
jgi:hypothetical protein